MAKVSNPSVWAFIKILFKHLSVKSETTPNLTLSTYMMYGVDIFQIYESFTHHSSIMFCLGSQSSI